MVLKSSLVRNQDTSFGVYETHGSQHTDVFLYMKQAVYRCATVWMGKELGKKSPESSLGSG